MRLLLTILISFLIPLTACRQEISPPTAAHSPTDLHVLAEAIDVERYTDGKILVSHLKIESIMSPAEMGDLQNTTIKARHANPDFKLYPGQHNLTLHRATPDGEWYLEPSTHGEIVDAAERKRRKDIKNWRDHNDDRFHSVKRELCFMKIKQAYDADITEFRLENANKCEKYIAEYNRLYRVRP